MESIIESEQELMRYTEIEGHDDYILYEDGTVYSKKSKKFLKHQTDNQGYLHVKLNNKTTKIHRLIAEAFIENPDNLAVVDHINRNKSDNRI